MSRERRNILVRALKRLKKSIKSMVCRQRKQQIYVTKTHDEMYYICVSGMSHDEQLYRTSRHVAINAFSSPEKINRFYIYSPEILKNDDNIEYWSPDINTHRICKNQLPEPNTGHSRIGNNELPFSSTCYLSIGKKQLPESECDIEDEEICNNKFPDNSLNELSFDELQDDQLDIVSSCDHEEADFIKSPGYFLMGSLEDLNMKGYQCHKTQNCENECRSSLTTDIMDTHCYETSGSLSELNSSSFSFDSDMSDLNPDFSENDFYDVHSVRDIKRNSENCDMPSLHDIVTTINSDRLELIIEPEVEGAIEESILDRPDTNHQEISSLRRKISHSHVKQHIYLLNYIGFNCFISSCLHLPLTTVTMQFRKHQLLQMLSYLMNKRILHEELVSREDLEMYGTVLTRQNSNQMSDLRPILNIEDILAIFSKTISLSTNEYKGKDIEDIACDMNFSPKIVSNPSRRLEITVELLKPYIRNMSSAPFVSHAGIKSLTSRSDVLIYIYNILENVLDVKHMMGVSSDETVSKAEINYVSGRRDIEKAHKQQAYVRIIDALTLPTTNNGLLVLDTLWFLNLPNLMIESTIDDAVCAGHFYDFSSFCQFAAILSFLTSKELGLSKYHILKMLKAQEDVNCHISQPFMTTTSLIQQDSDTTDKANLYCMQSKSIEAEISPFITFRMLESHNQKHQDTLIGMEKHYTILWKSFEFMDLYIEKAEIPIDHGVVVNTNMDECRKNDDVVDKKLMPLFPISLFTCDKLDKKMTFLDMNIMKKFIFLSAKSVNYEEFDTLTFKNVTREHSMLDSSCRHNDYISHLLEYYIDNEYLSHDSHSEHFVTLLLTLEKDNDYRNTLVNLIKDHIVCNTNLLYPVEILPNVCDATIHMLVEHSRNDMVVVLKQNLQNEEQLSNYIVTKFPLEVDKNHCDNIPLSLNSIASYTLHHSFVSFLTAFIINSSVTKSVQVDKEMVNKKGICERDFVHRFCQQNKTLNCLLTLTNILCNQLQSDDGEKKVMQDIISRRDFNGNGNANWSNDVGNNEKNFSSNRITKDSNTTRNSKTDFNYFGNGLHSKITGDSGTDFSGRRTRDLSNENINSKTDFSGSDMDHGSNETRHDQTGFSFIDLQRQFDVGRNRKASSSNGTGKEEVNLGYKYRSDSVDSCTKDKKKLKKLLLKFYNKKRQHRKHPPRIEFLVKSFFKEIKNDPSLKTFDKSRRNLIYRIFNQKFGNDCILFPLEQKAASEGTLEHGTPRTENEENPPEMEPVENSPRNEGLDAYFLEMEQSTQPTMLETMRFELMRLKSFWSFPRNIGVSPIMLARWGFYYTGTCAETHCFCCAASYRDWDDGDNPEVVHHRISPSCPFLTGTDDRNVPSYRSIDRPSATRVPSDARYRRLGAPSADTRSREQEAPETVVTTLPSAAASTSTGETQTSPATTSPQTTSVNTSVSSTASATHGTLASPSDAVSTVTTSTTSASTTAASNRNSGHSGNTVATTTDILVGVPGQARSSSTNRANTATSQSSASSETQRRYDPLGINFDKPRYPSYAVMSNRAESYASWPQYLREAREMAYAGFFYAGYGDYVRCFFCGGGLRNWDAQDDPWHEHAKWFPRCAFVRMNKGEKFVNNIQQELEEKERQETLGSTTSYQIDEATLGATAAPFHSEVDSSAVRAVRDMGVGEDVIKKALEVFHKRQDQGENSEELDATVLMNIILDELDEIDRSTTNEEQQTASGGGPFPPDAKSSSSDFVGSDSAISSNEDISEMFGNMPSLSGHIGANEKSKSLKKRRSKQKKRKHRKEKSDEVAQPVEIGEIDEEIESLQKENQHLREQLICKICCEKNVSVAFLPCGDLVCCDECAPAMRKCPICKDYIRGTVKTFFP